jgi:CheY-like chemotaxis protein
MLGARVHVTLALAAPGAWVMADPNKFERALINLAANGCDAMAEGGDLTIETRGVELVEDERHRVGSLPAGRYTEVRVTDTGGGMSEDVRAHLFEPFYTTRARDRHRGLGLSFVYGFMMQANGHVAVESRPGVGTTVRLHFPRQAAPRGVEDPVAAEIPGQEAMTVLVAEDEHGLRRLMRSCLERAGFIVLEAADGRAAVDLAARHSGRIDALVSDLVMPGMSGAQLAVHLALDRPEMAVLFVSGYGADTLGDLRTLSREPGLLRKPFTMRELVDGVRNLVAVSAGDAGATA